MVLNVSRCTQIDRLIVGNAGLSTHTPSLHSLTASCDYPSLDESHVCLRQGLIFLLTFCLIFLNCALIFSLFLAIAIVLCYVINGSVSVVLIAHSVHVVAG